MIIETKYNIGDTVYTKEKGWFKVGTIVIRHERPSKTSIVYYDLDAPHTPVLEENCYPSKACYLQKQIEILNNKILEELDKENSD